MSIRRIQTERLLEEVARAFYSSGVNPTLNEIFTKVAEYFSQYPPGTALPVPVDSFGIGLKSDVDALNSAMAHLAINVDTLYEASLMQVEDVMMLTTVMRTQLERLSRYRRRIETTIDDYLLSLYNTDGYYFSLSDTFSDTSLTDLRLTSAQVDTQLGAIALPSVGSLTTRLDSNLIGQPSISIDGSLNAAYIARSPWSGAIDGLNNTVWSIEVERPVSGEVVVVLTLPVGNSTNTVEASRVEVDPYGVVPVQVYVETGQQASTSNQVAYTSFGGKIVTNSNKMSFSDSVRELDSLRITLRKDRHDYVDKNSGSIKYRYIFGIKDLAITTTVHDSQATFVSTALQLPEDLTNDMVIDAVSLVADQDAPQGTEIKFYIATDNPSATAVSDFDWKDITPLDDTKSTSGQVVRYNGARTNIRYIRVVPRSAEDLAIIPMDTANIDLGLRNPSPLLIPGVDTYRIAKFTDTVLNNSVVLEEGINTVRIYHATYSSNAISSGLSFWGGAKLTDSNTRLTYGKTDTGNSFFWGGDIGESLRSVYVETYLESETDQKPLLAEFRKLDPNSKSWDVKVFLNGSEVGYLPVGTDKAIIPWSFRSGLNHIALIVNIPAGTVALPNPSNGTVSLLGDTNLQDHGTVKLATWSYVSYFDLMYNQANQPMTFTIKDGEIISRRKPSDNLRLRYSRPTGNGPVALRLRADLSRDDNNHHVSPRLNSYRLRFSYGAIEGTN